MLVLVLALGICLSPLSADAQQAAKVPRVGFLRTFPVPEMEKAFRQGLQELGLSRARTSSSSSATGTETRTGWPRWWPSCSG